MEIKIKEWTLDENKKYIVCVQDSAGVNSMRDRVRLIEAAGDYLRRKHLDNGNLYYFPFDIALEPLCAGDEFVFDGKTFVKVDKEKSNG